MEAALNAANMLLAIAALIWKPCASLSALIRVIVVEGLISSAESKNWELVLDGDSGTEQDWVIGVREAALSKILLDIFIPTIKRHLWIV